MTCVRLVYFVCFPLQDGLFCTELLAFYIELGLVVSDVKMLVEFQEMRLFDEFIDACVNLRRHADERAVCETDAEVAHEMKALSDTAKVCVLKRKNSLLTHFYAHFHVNSFHRLFRIRPMGNLAKTRTIKELFSYVMRWALIWP